MGNLSNFFQSSLAAANALFDSEQHDESKQVYEELLLQPQLPWTSRVKANVNLYELVDDWQLKHSYHEAAEAALIECRRRHPEASTSPEAERLIRTLRSILDENSQELLASRPEVLTPPEIALRGFETTTERQTSEEASEAEEDFDEEMPLPSPRKSAIWEEPAEAAEQHMEPSSSQLTGPPSQEFSSQVDEAAEHFTDDLVSAPEEDDEEQGYDGGVMLPGLGLNAPLSDRK